jgi:hypothetical protein
MFFVLFGNASILSQKSLWLSSIFSKSFPQLFLEIFFVLLAVTEHLITKRYKLAPASKPKG